MDPKDIGRFCFVKPSTKGDELAILVSYLTEGNIEENETC